MHDTFKSGLFTDLCQASRFFITYSPSSLKLLQVLAKQYNTNFRAKFQAHYSQGVRQHHIAFLNSDTQILIPNFTLTAPTKMFTFDNSKLIIHTSDHSSLWSNQGRRRIGTHPFILKSQMGKEGSLCAHGYQGVSG